ncbi:hypothetical protein ACFP3Q_02830 [Nocardioides sp. GCM10027113]|uniref:hypothetical protein n=1 Tax=unclassified Nocardioides TaxID=2615069 RepID=UPI00361F39DE
MRLRAVVWWVCFTAFCVANGTIAAKAWDNPWWYLVGFAWLAIGFFVGRWAARRGFTASGRPLGLPVAR